LGCLRVEDHRPGALAHPGPIGVVIDENTALVLKGSSAEVIGPGSVAPVDPAKDKVKRYLLLKASDVRDIAKLSRVCGIRVQYVDLVQVQNVRVTVQVAKVLHQYERLVVVTLIDLAALGNLSYHLSARCGLIVERV
jgi:hypothetical protein